MGVVQNLCKAAGDVERSSDLPSSSTNSCSHTHRQEAAKQGKKIPRVVVCYEKTKHKKKRNGDLNMSQKMCKQLEDYNPHPPVQTSLLPSLPPSLHSSSPTANPNPKNKQQ
jgi:hypothetical protein